VTRVDQLVHTFRARDAVSDEVRLFRDRLRARGFASSILAYDAEPAVVGEVERFDPRRLAADAVLYHHATAAGAGAQLARWRGPSALLYHGTTPPELLRADQPELAAVLAEGRAALRRIAPRFRARFADSAFGAEELRSLTGTTAAVLPYALDERRFAGAPTRPERPGWTSVRWITVGRVAPNKGLLALVAAFAAYARHDPGATLTLAGAYAPTDPYYWAVRRAIDANGAYGGVSFTGSIGDDDLAARYAASDVYVCASEHEGFCVPLLEAMRFDLPIVALARTAVPETLGDAGMLVRDGDPAALAAAVAALADDARRAAVVAAGRLRREAFSTAASLAAFDRAIDALIAG